MVQLPALRVIFLITLDALVKVCRDGERVKGVPGFTSPLPRSLILDTFQH